MGVNEIDSPWAPLMRMGHFLDMVWMKGLLWGHTKSLAKYEVFSISRHGWYSKQLRRFLEVGGGRRFFRWLFGKEKQINKDFNLDQLFIGPHAKNLDLDVFCAIQLIFKSCSRKKLYFDNQLFRWTRQVSKHIFKKNNSIFF